MLDVYVVKQNGAILGAYSSLTKARKACEEAAKQVQGVTDWLWLNTCTYCADTGESYGIEWLLVDQPLLD